MAPQKLIPWRRKEPERTLVVETEGVPDTLTNADLKKVAKTTTVLVDPGVVAQFLAWAARHRRNEVGALLLGRIEGRFLIIEATVLAERVGTATSVAFTPQDFERAQAATKKGQGTVGWAHSHPSYGSFMSGTDIRHQSEGQGLFPDYVGLVLDPFKAKGAEFCFFRVLDGKAVQIPHHYWNGGRAEA